MNELPTNRIESLGLKLPPAPKPAGVYRPTLLVDKFLYVDGLPKTRSGKIMRRILRKIAGGETTNLGDTSTLLDPSVVESIIKESIN